MVKNFNEIPFLDISNISAEIISDLFQRLTKLFSLESNSDILYNVDFVVISNLDVEIRCNWFDVYTDDNKTEKNIIQLSFDNDKGLKHGLNLLDVFIEEIYTGTEKHCKESQIIDNALCKLTKDEKDYLKKYYQNKR